jgi:hypothetical protein
LVILWADSTSFSEKPICLAGSLFSATKYYMFLRKPQEEGATGDSGSRQWRAQVWPPHWRDLGMDR